MGSQHNRTIKSLIFNATQNSGKMEQDGIYKIDCKCGQNYIGITERKISQRIAEHKRSIKCFDLNNAIAKLCLYFEINVAKQLGYLMTRYCTPHAIFLDAVDFPALNVDLFVCLF